MVSSDMKSCGKIIRRIYVVQRNMSQMHKWKHTAITLTSVVLPEFWRPTKVSSISCFQKRLRNQFKIDSMMEGSTICNYCTVNLIQLREEVILLLTGGKPQQPWTKKRGRKSDATGNKSPFWVSISPFAGRIFDTSPYKDFAFEASFRASASAISIRGY